MKHNIQISFRFHGLPAVPQFNFQLGDLKKSLFRRLDEQCFYFDSEWKFSIDTASTNSEPEALKCTGPKGEFIIARFFLKNNEVHTSWTSDKSGITIRKQGESKTERNWVIEISIHHNILMGLY